MKIQLIILSIVVGLVGLAGLFPAAFSVMMFDAPGSSSNPATITLFLSVATFPIVCLASIIAAWSFYSSQQMEVAGWVILSPALNIVAGCLAKGCLDIFYGGKFGG